MAREPQTPAEWQSRAAWARRKAAEFQAKLDAVADGYARAMLRRDVEKFNRIAEMADLMADPPRGDAA